MFSNALLLALVVFCLHGAASLEIPGVEIPGVDDSDYLFVKNALALNSTTTGTNSYAAAINYGRTHPTRDGGTWKNWYICFGNNEHLAGMNF